MAWCPPKMTVKMRILLKNELLQSACGACVPQRLNGAPPGSKAVTQSRGHFGNMFEGSVSLGSGQISLE